MMLLGSRSTQGIWKTEVAARVVTVAMAVKLLTKTSRFRTIKTLSACSLSLSLFYTSLLRFCWCLSLPLEPPLPHLGLLSASSAPISTHLW